MKILYFGGQKSGKSRLAEQRALALASENKPLYIATYDNSFGDAEMQARIKKHRLQRESRFLTVETPVDIAAHIRPGGTYLIDCMSMWILNTLEEEEEHVLAQIDKLSAIEAHIIFVLNDVASGIIPLDATSRKYVDRSGIVGQKLAQICDEVYEVKLGMGLRLK